MRTAREIAGSRYVILRSRGLETWATPRLPEAPFEVSAAVSCVPYERSAENEAVRAAKSDAKPSVVVRTDEAVVVFTIVDATGLHDPSRLTGQRVGSQVEVLLKAGAGPGVPVAIAGEVVHVDKGGLGRVVLAAGSALAAVGRWVEARARNDG